MKNYCVHTLEGTTIIQGTDVIVSDGILYIIVEDDENKGRIVDTPAIFNHWYFYHTDEFKCPSWQKWAGVPGSSDA